MYDTNYDFFGVLFIFSLDYHQIALDAAHIPNFNIVNMCENFKLVMQIFLVLAHTTPC